MKYCSECGKKLNKDGKCVSCEKETEFKNKAKDVYEKISDTADSTKQFTKKDIEENKYMAALSYIGILVLVPYCFERGSKYVKYHTHEGLKLLVLWAIVGILSFLINIIDIKAIYLLMIPILIPIYICAIILIALSVIGVVNALSGKAKELPLLGYFKLKK